MLDRIGGWIMGVMYLHSNATVNVKIRKAVVDNNYELVFLGSSRCHHHYVTKIFEDTLSLNAYNAGVRGGSNIYFNYALVQLMLKHSSPKYIVYDLIHGDFTNEPHSYDKLIPLSPYYGCSQSVDALFDEAQLGWKYNISHLYKYNGKLLTTISGLFLPLDTIDKGYQPKFGKINPNISAINETVSYNVDANKIRYLSKFVRLCRRKGIVVIFTLSPIFNYKAPKDYEEIRSFAKNNNIILLDYLNSHYLSGNTRLFYDEMHLNDEGAHVYSSMIAHDLKNIIVQ